MSARREIAHGGRGRVLCVRGIYEGAGVGVGVECTAWGQEGRMDTSDMSVSHAEGTTKRGGKVD